MKIGFLYAGQGSQFEQMGKGLYETQPVFKQTFDAVDPTGEIKQLCFEENLAELSKTVNTQPCMVAFAVAITNMLDSMGVKPDMVAGLSLGEYSALHCAGVFSDKQAVDLVAFRGKEMESASKGLDCKMMSILGLSRELLEQACKQASRVGVVSIANYNSPAQLVIAGETEACQKAADFAIEYGARRALKLNVSGPFHTELMKPAGDALEKRFATEDFSDMKIPVVFNSLGKEKAPEDNIKDILVKQVQSSVYFEDSIRYMIKEGVDTFIEIGGGKVLSSFVKKVSESVETYAVYDVKTLEDTINHLKGDS
ncbi:MAG: ACP S-malonyltransferase [Clostridia bacterium]